MTDMRLVCAEMRAAELLTVLQSALNGEPHWRRDARNLLGSISNTGVKEQVDARLRELDGLRRAAEMGDVCHGA